MAQMWFNQALIFNLNNYIIMLLAIVSTTGDYLVTHSKLHLFQALFDNATHAIIGGLSWLFVCVNFKNRSHLQTITEIGLCAAVASMIDLDHFVSARSFSLKEATNLQRRPPLHCSTIPLVCCTVFLVLGYFLQIDLYKKVALILLAAFASHHTRDATRRGFWFYPFGSTPPIPYCFYVALTCSIPYFICLLHKAAKVESSKYTYLNRESVI